MTPTMQDALIRLTSYWAGHGCLVGQPMNTEVGAGTFNPSTVLRALGPEPWRVAYVEPSVRPDDSRYGDNPNRLQTHTQFQVLLKPEPGDAQSLYLGSLAALGIDLGAHDVRFVEDDWASPSLGAWGLGWEVWLDGLEITQFTYFQQSGGLTLDPVSVEITYGVERIIMALQGVSHFKDIEYAPGISYGEAFGQAEYEMSRYYLDDADISANRALFETYEAEARRMIEARLPVPAHSYVLKCSHTFNVLDARGAVGTTERARAFARMRALSHEVAGLWADRRAELGHPLGDATPRPAEPPAPPSSYPELSEPAVFALEIGVEEMPPAEIDPLATRTTQALTDLLERSGLLADESTFDTYATPRRIIVIAHDIEPREPDTHHTTRGPRVTAAHDLEGRPTKALEGFARSQGITPADVTVDEGATHVTHTRSVPGRPASQVLTEELPHLITNLKATQNMRWNTPALTFTRPIRWLLALLNNHEIPFKVANLTAGRTTHARGERLVVDGAGDLVAALRRNGVEPSVAERRRGVIEQVKALTGMEELVGESGAIEEIVQLVEGPVGILGSFDKRYLGLPEAVLTTVMKKHQRYVPVRGRGGELLPLFVAVADGECDRDVVRAGNEAVLRARYEDAAFFFEHDLRVAPDEMKKGLERLTFEERLGSMADRAGRIRAIAAELAERLELGEDETTTLRRAGELAKFDLASSMVIELSGLAGTMAGEYASRAGEEPGVATALYEMELPRQAGDTLPEGIPGALLAVADRLDLLAGLFGVGSAPTGSSDPFGLRRAALGLTAILRARPRLAPITVPDGLAAAARVQPVPVGAGAPEEAGRFVTRRFEQALLDEGRPIAVVRAVLPHAAEPARAARAAADLEGLLADERFTTLTAALQRVLRIVPEGTPPVYDPARFQEPVEHRLHEALTEAVARKGNTLPEFTEAALPLAPVIDDYFDRVLVMADDPVLRAARLGLLAAVRDLATPVLDWSEIA